MAVKKKKGGKTKWAGTKTKQIKRWDVCSLEQNCIDSETSLFDMIHQLRFERAIHIAFTILCVKIIFHQTSLSCILFSLLRKVPKRHVSQCAVQRARLLFDTGAQKSQSASRPPPEWRLGVLSV